MKKILLGISILLVALSAKLQAQIVNNSFENWYLDTFYLAADTIGTLPADTEVINEPVGWTTSNFLTGLEALGGRSLVVQSAHAYSGNSAIEMFTDTVHVPPGLIKNFPFSSITLPGFAVIGSFPVGPSTFTNSSVITPASIPGAGQPFTQRLATINGYYDYKPVFDTNTHSFDTCEIWATLRNGSTVIANAIFKSTDSTGGYVPFSATFNYVSCELPDTLVVLLASSATNVSTFLPVGTAPLQPGSTLWVDSIYYDTLVAGFVMPPFVQGYVYSGYENQTDTINILLLANDTNCGGGALTVSIFSGPDHGSASIYENNIVYTPTTGFTGLDSIYYEVTNAGGDSGVALCQVFINESLGINPLNQLALGLYPNPAGDEMNIQFQNPGKCQALIYDMTGRLVLTSQLDKNNNPLNIEPLANGFYNLQIINAQNMAIAKGKFAVVR